MMQCLKPHLSVELWLQKLELPQYLPMFSSYDGVEDMLHLSERELKDMGIRNGSHRARMATSISILKEKYQRAHKSPSPSPNTSTLSLKADNSSSKSQESFSSVHHLNVESTPPGIRSWPSSGPSSLNSTRYSSHRSSMEESFGTNGTPKELRKALEWELNLDRSDLRSHAWYHGTILRQRAEELIAKNGDFIVRDCISQPGDFVITCRWNDLPLHFIIKKVILQPDTIYEKIQFCFESERFDSIYDFITYYVGSQCPLSSSSGAIICSPINRTKPLSYYSAFYGAQCQVHYATKALEKLPQMNEQHDETRMMQSPSSSSGIADDHTAFPTDNVSNSKSRLMRVGSDPTINPNAERKHLEHRPNSGTFITEAGKELVFQMENNNPPPKPSRVPSRKWMNKPPVKRRERRNSPPTPLFEITNKNDNEVFVSTEPSTSDLLETFHEFRRPIPVRRMMSGETRFSFLDHRSISSEGSLSDPDMLCTPFTLPKMQSESCFDPLSFHSPSLLSEDNSCLDPSVLTKVRHLLVNVESKHLASHLTRVDLEATKTFSREDLGLGVTSGLEMMLLPQGRRLREDLLERTECMKTFVAVTILTCTSEEERVCILEKWIRVAMDTKNMYGNVYGFTGIMLGLTIPQITNLHHTWLETRRWHTDTTFSFETKLRPIFKALQSGTMNYPPNTCIPFMWSLLTFLNTDDGNNTEEFSGGSPGEMHGDFGLQILDDHLQACRSILEQSPVFHSNAEMLLRGEKHEPVLLNVFQTEFHLRMLWGSRGCIVESTERHKKFQHVLEMLFLLYQKQFEHT